jgi:hypothetical protein
MKIAAVVIAASLVAGSASAGVIHQRFVNQQDRIANGIATGQLSPREATRIERQEAALGTEVHYFRADGSLSPRERAIVNVQQNRLSREIYRQKHDRNWW